MATTPQSLPPLAPVPPAEIRKLIPNPEWPACLDAWIALAELRLNLSQPDFNLSVSQDESTSSFLCSYMQNARALFAPSATPDGTGVEARSVTLRRLCFLLSRRLLLEVQPTPPELLEWPFISAFCDIYHSSSATKALLLEVWAKYGEALTLSIENGKAIVMKQLSLPGISKSAEAGQNLQTLTLLAFTLPAAGSILMTGSDYLDTLFDAYKNYQKNASLRKALVANVYVGFTSLLKLEPPVVSLLLDQLYSLKAAAKVDVGGVPREPTLLSDLVCSTNLLSRLEATLASTPQKRSGSLLASLRVYQAECSSFHTRYQRARRRDKGKGRAVETDTGTSEIHIHKMSLITQIQDLFPNLGSAYISKLLDNYADDVETVISHLLEGSLPPHLRDLDETAQLPPSGPPTTHFSPRATPFTPASASPALQPTADTAAAAAPPPTMPSRKNVFDNDAFDRLTISPANLHIGRANPSLTTEDILADRSDHTAKKAAILSALAAFDSDDDERDDTYDLADVGGTVDSLPPGTDADADITMDRQQPPTESNDTKLYTLYKTNPSLFARDAPTRRSPHRANLRRETGMTDEAIEGWALMLSRDPKRAARFERNIQLAGAGGPAQHQQVDLPSTAYRRSAAAEAEDEDEIDSSGPGFNARGGGRGGRGRGGGGGGGRGRGGAGNVAGPSSGDKDTALARQRKDANKSSRANHNRRDQRAKKMARGGGGL
ncbi:hypothetical protein AJ80_04065 [Polytolypa hystricis UAMH7299]|uniref:CUE domain-containing protein n=1 Tax=Polytolypa hystricis (strain UAMH7299) TaxID=1447883 RepID=A0A2B7YEK8_POLH7|nr:hypothetical protein AJ80_04065 [Polytolypa hystricis UAMH7299]